MQNRTARKLLQTQISGLEALFPLLDKNFKQIVHVISSCTGHIVVTGIGKSGIIGKKMLATMSSLGIPSFFLCPFNATHGDIGMVMQNDIVILISNSGEAIELSTVLNYCKTRKNTTIAITRSDRSTLATNADYAIILPNTPEGNDFGAPATSTTQTLVIGDILAISAAQKRNFTKEQYAQLHPSGNLGKKISKVTAIMNTEFETVHNAADIVEVTKKMTTNSNGFVCITDKNDKLCGIITDGDIRRAILKNNGQVQSLKATEICNLNPKFLTEGDYVIDASNIITEYKIGVVVVVDGNHSPIGFISRNQFNV